LSGVDTRPMLALLQQHVGGCREELDSDKCWKPAEYVLWGKLTPAEGLGPRCHTHARRYISESGLASRSDWALIRLADLALDIALADEAVDKVGLSIAASRACNGRPSGIPEDSLDFNDPVDRCAALAHRAGFERIRDAAGLLDIADGQVLIAHTWSRLNPAERQTLRRRATELLAAGLSGRELRSRPEDNVA
jgi:hypothetical protein